MIIFNTSLRILVSSSHYEVSFLPSHEGETDAVDSQGVRQWGVRGLNSVRGKALGERDDVDEDDPFSPIKMGFLVFLILKSVILDLN